MVTDRELVAGGSELPMPESVQGIVAARLDALPEEEKTLLQDASVLGKVFWLGAAAEIGGVDRTAAEAALHRLERKEFVRRERRPSVAGESEYAFGHLLVRDVAYGQIPRARRAEKHRLAGEWIEKLGRPEDHAEMLAHHYSSALELARAAGADTASLEGPAQARSAGSRRSRVCPQRLSDGEEVLCRCAGSLARGRAAEPGTADSLRPRPQQRRARGGGRPARAGGRGRAARAAIRGAAAEAETLMCEMYWLMGRRDDAFEHLRVAEELVEDEPSSYAKAYVMANASRFWMLAGASDDAIRGGLEALAMAEELGLEELQAHALDNIGVTRLGMGDERGFEDLERSIAIADSINSVESARAYGNLASALDDFGELERGVRDAERGAPARRAVRAGRLDPVVTRGGRL